MRIVCLLTALFWLPQVFAQTGPGGIGTNEGTSTLELWLTTSDLQSAGYINGDDVITWPDLSGNNVDATNIANFPSFVSNQLNGHPVIQFDRTAFERLIGNLSVDINAPLTVVVAGYFDDIAQTVGTGQFLFNLGPGGVSAANSQISVGRQNQGNSPSHSYYSWNGDARYVGTNSITAQQWDFFVGTYNSAMPFHTAFIDNVQQTVSDFPGALSNVAGVRQFAIGGSVFSGGTGLVLNGRIAEVMVFSHAINAAQRNIIFNYLSAKFDQPIANDLFDNDLPINGDYDLNVIGVGVEASGSHPTASSRGFELSIVSGFENGDYVMAGHRTPVNSLDITSAPTGVEAFWSREWSIDVTNSGSPTVVDIVFDFSEAGMGGTPLNAGNYQLLRNPGTGWEVVTTASSLIGDRVVFENISIETNTSYTLGTTNLTTSPLSLNQVQAGSGPGGLGSSSQSGALLLWLDASQLATPPVDDTPVAQWNDLSGNSHNATQITLANQPIYETNQLNTNLSTIRFDGVDDFMTGTVSDFNAPGTIIAVGNFAQPNQGAVDNDYIFDIGAAQPDLVANRASISRRRNDDVPVRTNRFYTFAGETLNDLQYGPIVSGSAFHIFTSVYQTTSPFHQLFLDGLETYTASGNGALNTNGSYTLGSWAGGAPNFLLGDVAEVILFNSVLNSAQVRILHASLAAKWGLTISSDLYNGDDAPGNNDHQVSGVGRTMDTEMSTGYSSGMTVALTGDAQDGSFVLFGHNSDANGVNTTDIDGAGITERLNRVWYFTFTNASGNEVGSITFDYSDMGITGTPFGLTSDFALIHRVGTSGTWSIVTTASSIIGDRFTFTAPSISANGYYTMASINEASLPVELMAFSATLSTEDYSVTTLHWRTASEKDNHFFSIERSGDGKQWELIATMFSKSINGGGAEYELIDHDLPPGTSYYRLKQTDFDGQESFQGGVKRVMNKESEVSIHVYPNPSTGELHVLSESPLPIGSSIEIININGLTQQTHTVGKESMNRLDWNGSPGIYLFLVKNNDRVIYSTRVSIH
jgi:hypothetical protein